MKTEKTVIVIFIIGLLAKFFDIPGCEILLIISSAILSIIYFPLSFYFFSDKTLKTQNIPLSIAGGMFISITVLGILFKLMFWPGAAIQLFAGIITMPILLLVTFLLFKNLKNNDLVVYYKNYLLRTIFWTVLCFVSFTLSNKQLLQIQHRGNPELVQLKMNAYFNNSNIEAKQALDNYYRRRDSLYLVNERNQ